jgi:hypothetical protein
MSRGAGSQTWAERVTEALASCGGSATLHQIYDALEANGNLKPSDLEPQAKRQSPRYQRIVRARLRELVQCGQVEHTGDGEYALSR